jgi:tRNA A37 threonylcarbamoyladenosine biosynthesis protein TsaE
MGLAANVPVTSPTYTYMNEYHIESGGGAGWYAHLDLYRASSGLDVGELGVFDARPFRGLIVEWPEMLADPESLAPTHILRIAMADGGSSRSYELQTRI